MVLLVMVVTQEIGMTIKIKVGDIVTCKYEPEYWDVDDNDTEYDEGDSNCLPTGEHPGFTSDMQSMIGNDYVVKAVHPRQPWVTLEDEYGEPFYWHTDWLVVTTTVELSEFDMTSQHKNVIIKIKRMNARRKGAGYVF